MAQLKTARMSDDTIGDQIDNHIAALEAELAVLLGISLNTDYADSLFDAVAKLSGISGFVTWENIVHRITGQNRFRYLNSMAKVTKSADQAIPDSTITLVSFNADEFDTDGIHDVATNNSRLIARISGKHLVGGMQQWAASAVGFRQLLFGVNGTLNFSNRVAPAPGGGTDQMASWPVSLSIGDYVEMSAQQTSGADLNLIGGGGGNTHFWMIYQGE